MRGILGVEFAEQGDEIRAGVAIPYDLGNPASVQIKASQ